MAAESKSGGTAWQASRKKQRASVFQGPSTFGLIRHPATTSVSSRHLRESSYFCWERSSHFAPHRTSAPIEPKRGPDGIRTRICYRREVPCFRYTTGPTRL